ncbi:unnamed protein product [Strongylus vulgaris]|uniref:FERM domain-containing protein n=1 Tax=Strongylus vulgaris TaxID=40348 RepID=A0A3P7IWN6_STRVU|nr:unnamed protein product [Strongylus vulgaris]
MTIEAQIPSVIKDPTTRWLSVLINKKRLSILSSPLTFRRVSAKERVAQSFKQLQQNNLFFRGMSPGESDFAMLEVARRCDFYGIKLHPAKNWATSFVLIFFEKNMLFA